MYYNTHSVAGEDTKATTRLLTICRCRERLVSVAESICSRSQNLIMKSCKKWMVIGCLVLCYAGASGQDSTYNSSVDSATLIIYPYLYWLDDVFSKNTRAEFNFKSMHPQLFYPEHRVTGVFCKMEHRIEATSHFAPRFRLGSVNYTDWMEGKKPFFSRYAK